MELVVIFFMDFIWKEVDGGKVIGLVFIDLFKVFDIISYFVFFF